MVEHFLEFPDNVFPALGVKRKRFENAPFGVFRPQFAERFGIAAVDDRGNRNLADAALRAKVKRMIFVSILTADKTPQIPHLYQKFLTEEYFEKINLPYVSLRPGAFLDQELERRKTGFSQGALGTVVKADVPLTYILADTVARCAAEALIVSGIEGERIDLGLSEPTTSRDLAHELSRVLQRPIEPQFAEFSTGDADFDAFIAYMNTGQYVADVEKQKRFFSPVPTLAESVRRWAAENNLLENNQ